MEWNKGLLCNETCEEKQVMAFWTALQWAHFIGYIMAKSVSTFFPAMFICAPHVTDHVIPYFVFNIAEMAF